MTDSIKHALLGALCAAGLAVVWGIFGKLAFALIPV
jgi:hypothetical protein